MKEPPTYVVPFTRAAYGCRSEWGPDAVTALAPADAIIVVDVFSFTTCVDVAASRGVAILPFAWNDPSAADFATTRRAELAGKRRKTRYSLAPESYLDAPAGFRCVLPSPNGARVMLAAAASGALVLAECPRNASAVAAAAQQPGRTFNVIPAGERWLDGGLRPALEDALGAGAILSARPGSRSPEAEAMVAIFEARRDSLIETLAACGSGRERTARGHRRGKLIAGDLDASRSLPIRRHRLRRGMNH